MGSIFKSKPTVVNVPQSQRVAGSSEVKPYGEVEPYIKSYLPALEDVFTQDPSLYTGALTPGQSQSTQDALSGYGQLANQFGTSVEQGGMGMPQSLQQAYQQQVGRATQDPLADPLYQAQIGTIADQARALTERDKQTAQEQAINAGQFGVGSTALAELQELQRRQREETTRSGMYQALQGADTRQTAAMNQLPAYSQQVAQQSALPYTLQEGIGKAQEGYEQAGLADAARLAQQGQEAQRKQAINYANMLGSLAGLGTSTAYQSSAQGTQGQAFPGTSPFQTALQVGGLLKGGFG
tara:strand:- start:864 stop:1751 length:888 start_codon:yes stop_codon:yes gene_type:complete